MKIEEAIKAMRKGKICRCKNRYYTIIDKCIFRLCKSDPTKNYVRIFGVANIKGQDFVTNEWEIMKSLILVTDGSEFY